MSRLLKKNGLFLQARINSNRMPGKTMLPLFGIPLIHQILKRLEVIPADVKAILTTKECGKVFKKIADEMGWEVFCGDEQNVLKRYVQACMKYNTDIVIRATADNPLVSPEIAIETIDLFHKENCDLAYLSPVPYGSGVEVIKSSSLVTALKNSDVPYHLEHVTPYIYENSNKFKIRTLSFNDRTVSRENVRLTVDTEEDFQRMNYLYRNIIKRNNNFKINSIIKVYDETKFIKYKRLLFITAFSGDYGIGHVKRALLLAKNLGSDYQIFFSFKHGDPKKINEFFDFNFNLVNYNELKNFVEKEGIFDRIIVDLRDTIVDEMKYYKILGPVISFDDMSDGGQISDLNFKTIPALLEYGNRKFNYEGINYLLTDVTKQKSEIKIKNIKNILITFGGSDPSDLTDKIALPLSKMGYKLTIIKGPFYNVKNNFSEIENCNVVKGTSGIEEYIKKSDLIFTSFGVTFFESLILNKPVIIINPTDYHDRLTKDFQYPYHIIIDNSHNENFENYLNNLLKDQIGNLVKENSGKKNKEEYPLHNFFSMNIGENIKELFKIIKEYNFTLNVCPNCSRTNDKILYRTKNWNLTKCPKCGLYYLIHIFHEEKKDIYGKKYFSEEYKEKYGKTYVQDKENITELAKKRVKVIKSYIDNGKLLDFGSGLGFFSEYCEQIGFKTLSIDKSKYASNYIQNELKLDSICADAGYFEKSNTPFDVITSFYVIEHIREYRKLLFLFKCHLKRNGVLALSTPNASGVMVKYNFNEYVVNHPDDHYIILSPKLLKKTLKEFGFGNIKVVVTGIHPERFFKSFKMLKLLDIKIFKNLFVFAAKLFKLGDTFEIYAQKLRD